MPHIHCQNCGAHFERKGELESHKRDCHDDQAARKAAAQPGSPDEVEAQSEGDEQRKNRVFTRSYPE